MIILITGTLNELCRPLTSVDVLFFFIPFHKSQPLNQTQVRYVYKLVYFVGTDNQSFQ